jgi:hypothetical protein
VNDTDRIRKYLERYGTLSPLEFDGSMPVADGGKPIKRVAARIKELRDQGLVIRTSRRRGMAFYELVRNLQGGVLLTREAEGGVLFRPGFDELVPPRNAILGEEAA